MSSFSFHSSDSFSLFSYNLLAQQYFRHTEFHYYPHTPSARLSLFRAQLMKFNADIYAFQEAEIDRFDRELAKQIKRQEEEKETKKTKQVRNNSASSSPNHSAPPSPALSHLPDSCSFSPSETNEQEQEQDLGSFLRSLGYSLCLQVNANRSKGHNVCVAFAWKTEKFDLFWQEARSRALCIGLKDKQTKQTNSMLKHLYLANVHLQGHPSQSQERFNQVSSLVKQIKKQIRRDAENQNWKFQSQEQENRLYENSNVLITGDFNCGRNSVVYSSLLNPQLYNGSLVPHLDSESGVFINTKDFSSPFALTDSYAEAEVEHQKERKSCNESTDSSIIPRLFTYARPNQGFLIDFLFYSSQSLRCLRVQQLFDSDKEREEIFRSGLPNAYLPSDHLPIGGVFQMKIKNETETN
jgi:mRNA deadenylase 3'-5' endonuclease subunit Ccr4